MILYKYIPYRPEFFSNYLIRISGKNALNDPFEFLPSHSYLSDLFIQQGSTALGTTKSEIESRLGEQFNFKAWLTMGAGILDEHGVISLSETDDNLLMWAHYADQHQGIVIGLDSTHKSFSTNYSISDAPLVGKISRVRYRKSRLHEFKDHYDTFFVKSDEWLYEKEHRFLLKLEQSTKMLVKKNHIPKYGLGLLDAKIRTFSDDLNEITEFQNSFVRDSNVLFMYEIPKEAIVSIGTGVRMNDQNKKNIQAAISNNDELKNVNLFSYKLDNYRFELTKQPMNI
jgi:hypothetical protein